MSLPRVVAVAPGSPAERAGLAPGDEVVSIGGQIPRDILEWRFLVEEADIELEIRPRGATSLRWLRALLDEGVEVHGQVVVCPGINDREVLNDTLAGVLDEYSQLASLCVVPLGISAHSNEPAMRDHTLDEAIAVVDL